MNGNYHTHERHPMFTQALHEHEHLHQAVDKIHAMLDKYAKHDITQGEVAEATGVVQSLYDQMRKHFEQEEEGGYLEEAITRVPTLAAQAAVLQQQHAELSQIAGQMLADAGSIGRPVDVWTRLKADYARFAKKLLGHEAAENKLLERAFNEDLGVDT